METFNGHWAGHNGCLLLSELRRRHQHSILNRFLLKTSFNSLQSFTFATCLIHWPLSPAISSVSWCRSCFVCSGLTYEIYSGGGPSRYVYCMVIHSYSHGGYQSTHTNPPKTGRRPSGGHQSTYITQWKQEEAPLGISQYTYTTQWKQEEAPLGISQYTYTTHW